MAEEEAVTTMAVTVITMDTRNITAIIITKDMAVITGTTSKSTTITGATTKSTTITATATTITMARDTASPIDTIERTIPATDMVCTFPSLIPTSDLASAQASTSNTKFKYVIRR